MSKIIEYIVTFKLIQLLEPPLYSIKLVDGLNNFIALETKFVVSTSSWAAVDLPLTYAFKASHGYGIVSTLAPFALRATVEDVYLPVGDVRVSCVAVRKSTSASGRPGGIIYYCGRLDAVRECLASSHEAS